MVIHRVRRGEHAAIWSAGGDVKIIRGPQVVTTVFSRFQRLQAYRAAENQYLQVTFSDGHVENIPGPTRFEFHPLEHVHVQVHQGFSLTSHEALIIYRKEQKQYNETLGETLGGEAVKRIIVYGPMMHIPKSGEWIHEFSWHGTNDKNKCALIPGANKFTKLQLIADQFYYNIRDVRTADEALLEIKVMIFYELENLELMLDSTHDPIADFINACCADVVAFVSQRTYERFVEQTGELNAIETYSQLTMRATKIGYNITKVVFRGFHACENLQKMHNHSIEMRTKLRLQAEEERQVQELADLKLQKENSRLVQQNETDRVVKREAHALELELAAEADQAKLTSKQREAELEMELTRKVHEQELQFLQQRNELNVQLWSQMKNVGVDLTSYLTAQYEKPAKIIRIDGGSGGSPALTQQFNV